MEAFWTKPRDVVGRIDAEYYRSDFVVAASRLQSNCTTRSFSRLWKECNRIYIGIAGFQDVEDKKEYIPYLRPVDITLEGQIQYDNLPWCERHWLDDHGKNGCAKPGDLIVEVKGNTRKAAVVDHRIPNNCIVSGSSYRIRLKPEYDPYFYQAFFTSDTGQLLKRRVTSNTTINYIDPESFKHFSVPAVDKAIQHAIGNKVRKAERLREMAALLVKSADRDTAAVVVEPLSCSLDTDPVLGPSQVKSLGESCLAIRLSAHWVSPQTYPIGAMSVDTERDGYHATWLHTGDFAEVMTAQAYRPPVVQTLRFLKERSDTSSLANLSSRPIETGMTPVYAEHGIKCAKTRNVRRLFVELYGADHVPDQFAAQNPHAMAGTGTILMNKSGAGSLGRCGIYLDDAPLFVSQEQIRIVIDRADPAYVACFLSSWWGQRAIERTITGSTGQSHLYVPALRQIPIPLPAAQVQRLIGWKIKVAHLASTTAASLIHGAKDAVESLIDGTLDEATFLAEGKAIEQWLADNPSPHDTEKP